MPLIQGKSKKSFSKNVETEMDAGKPQKQSLAIAFSVARKNRKKKAQGGIISAKDEDEATLDNAQKGVSPSDPTEDEGEAGKESMSGIDDSMDSREMDMEVDMPGMEKGIDARDEGMDDADDARDDKDLHMEEHERGQMGKYKSPNAKGSHRWEGQYAEGGRVRSQPTSVAEAILLKGKKKMAEGGRVDISRNADEDANMEDQYNYDSLRKENYSETPGLKELDYDTDKMMGHSLPDEDEHSLNMIDSILQRMKSRRMR